ncbi:MAG: NACHT domain-containing protein [Acidimicrobiales bacterium]
MAQPMERRRRWRGSRRLVHRVRTRLLRSRLLWWGPRRRRVLGAIGIGLAVVVLAAVGLRASADTDVDDACAERPVACSLATNLGSSALLALVVSIVWVGGFGQRRALRHYRRRLTSDPGALLDLPVSMSDGRVFQRQALTTAMLEDLRSSARGDPLVIEGDTGTGKSVALCELARDLSERRLVPVLATLRATPLSRSVEDQTKAVFWSLVDPLLWSTDHADRIWRRLRRSGRLVFLLDGLDEALLPGSPSAADIAMQRFFSTLASAGRTVVTCRPHLVPPTAACSRFAIPDLALDEALQVVQQRAGSHGPLDGHLLSETVEALKRTGAEQCPFFADLIGQVLASGRSLGAVPETTDRARVAVLDRAYDDLPVGLRPALERLAGDLLRLGRYEARLSSVMGPDDPQVQPVLSFDVLEQAVALDVLRTRELAREETVRFSHPILVAYFAALAMATGPVDAAAAADAVVNFAASPLPEADQAVVWAASRGDARAWLARLDGGTRTDGRTAVAAVRICDAAGLGLPHWLRRWVETGPLPATPQQHQLLAIAAQSRETWAVNVLLKLQERSQDYGVRWASAIHLGERGENSTVTRWARATVNKIATAPETDRGLLLQEGLLWFGPSVAGDRDLPDEHWMTVVAGHVRAVSDLDVPGALGAESSLAQGLKLAARLRRPVDAVLFEPTVRRARFWFARLEACLGLGYLADDHRSDPVARPLLRHARQDPHPLVRAAAQLASRCWSSGSSHGLVWLNEHAAVNKPHSWLTPDAILLLADTVVLLNLSNNATQAQRDANGRRTDLPKCLAAEAARPALTGEGCADGCEFGLCPYDRASPDRWSRGNFPEAFCRSVRNAVDAVGAPPWYRGSGSTYLAFWRTLEHGAAGHDSGHTRRLKRPTRRLDA